MKKKLIASFLSAVMTITFFTSVTAMSKTLYAPDGRSIKVDNSSVDKWVAVGWYTTPVIKIYSLSGKDTIIYKSELDSWKAVGWYESPVVKMYSPGGNSHIVYESEIDMWKAVGWYTDPVRNVYSPSGQEVVVLQKDFQAWIDAGWYEEPVMKIYSADGREIVIYTKDFTTWGNVGWYNTPVVKLYAEGGKTVVVAKDELYSWTSVGWYLLDDYIASVINVNGFEKALDALDNLYMAKSINEKTYGNKYADVCNKYYHTVGVPLVVLDWEKGIDSQGFPEITITFRNISSKTITSISQIFTCMDEWGNVTTDLGEYNGNVTGTMSGISIDSGIKFAAAVSLYGNSKTHSITWPKILAITYSDGTSWSRY